MRISLVQTDIVWENKAENLAKTGKNIWKLQQKTDLVVLPEMFTTGFSMNSCQLAETIKGETINTIKNWSHEFGFAITGSFIATENNKHYNRGFFITPSGEEFYYDKWHLFRMGTEPQYFDAGNRSLVITYKEWNIRLAICYDLRFPVWLRNQNNKYDLLIVVASWPSVRKVAWETLLKARAIENQCYVCGVNRIGIDGNRLEYSGQSLLFNEKGDTVVQFADFEEGIQTYEMDLEALKFFRKKFPAWQDADSFNLLD